MRRIGIVGARMHGRPDLVRALVRSFAGQDVEIVSGGAPGIDTWAEDEARALGLAVRVKHPVEYTRNALLARNLEIVNDGLAELHTFPWWGARGTYHAMSAAKKAGVSVVEHKPEPLVEVWTTRLGSRDPDELNITRKSAKDRYEALHDTAAARFLDAPDGGTPPLRRIYEMALEMEQAGRSLLELQRAAVLPTPFMLGEPWAPSMALLGPALAMRRRGGVAAERAWARYVPAFEGEMRASLRDAAIAWGWLLARPLRGTPEAPSPSRVCLACFCEDHEHCHRTLVAEMLGKLGAVVRGELPPQRSSMY